MTKRCEKPDNNSKVIEDEKEREEGKEVTGGGESSSEGRRTVRSTPLIASLVAPPTF